MTNSLINGITRMMKDGVSSLDQEKDQEKLNRTNIIEILSSSLSYESRMFLLQLEKEDLNKEKLRDSANAMYYDLQKQQGVKEIKSLITSRYGLDLHANRLEGAGLVIVKKIGVAKLYSMTPLGKEVFEHAKLNPKDN